MSRDLEATLIAWKTLLIKESELEDKMHTLLIKNNDIDTYQRVMMFEMWKINDAMFDENSFDLPEMITAFHHYNVHKD